MTDDLTPQEPRAARSPRRRIVPAIIAVGVLVAVVGLVWNLVGGSLFFYNADEAVERRTDLGDERFTLQGSPIGCSINEGFQGDDPVVTFSVSFGGEAVEHGVRGGDGARTDGHGALAPALGHLLLDLLVGGLGRLLTLDRDLGLLDGLVGVEQRLRLCGVLGVGGEECFISSAVD